jgi:hypothetical protein
MNAMTFKPILSALALLLLALPAEAQMMPSADLQAGHTLGLGFAGMAYDYGLGGRYGLGGSLSAPLWQSGGAWMKLDARTQARFIDESDFKAAAIAGLRLDPGGLGQRSYLIPDAGIGVAYTRELWGVPLTLRLNVTLTIDQGQTGNFPTGVAGVDGIPYDSTMPRPNLLQRLTFGPNTNVALAAKLSDRFELSLGGGTIVGLRYHY